MPTDCQANEDHERRKQLAKEFTDLLEVCVLFVEAFDLDIGITRAQLNALPTALHGSSDHTSAQAAHQEEAGTA